MLFHNLHYLNRLQHILTVFFEEGFDYLITRAHLHHYVPFSKRLQAALLAREKAWKPEIHFRMALERLGPTFIKFGQALSLRPDFLPPPYIAELEKMQDHAPTVPLSEITRIIREEFGKETGELFRSFDPKPLASASLAQVHKARLKSGEWVAVKVQRPGIEKTVREDIEILLVLAHWIDKHHLLTIPVTSIVEEFKRWTLRELNFHNEAVNFKITRKNFERSREVLIPEVFETLTGMHVLTTGFVDGVPLHDIPRLKKQHVRAIIDQGYTAMLEMVFVHGFFHADPHPGNILVTNDNRIAFVDFGIVGRIDDELRKTLLHMFDALLEDDTERFIDLLLSITSKRERTDIPRLKQELHDMIEQVRADELRDLNVGQLLHDAVGILRRYQLDVAVDFVLFAKTVLTLEGIGLRYNPDFKLMAETTPLIRKILLRERSPSVVFKRARRQVRTYQQLLEKTPLYLQETLEHLSRGKLDVEIVPTEFRELRVELEHGAGNIAIGLMTAALIVSSALIMQVIDAPRTLGIPTLSLLGFSCSLALGVWLIRRTLFAIHKRGEKQWT